MPVEKLPLWAADEKQSDTPGAYARQQMNGVWTQGTVGGEAALLWQARPGRALWADLGQAAHVDGTFWWTRGEKIAATCNGKTFFVNQDGTFNEKTGTGTQVANVRPTFADVDGTALFAASSGQIGKYFSGAGNDGAFLSDPDAPATVTHLATLNKTLMALRANSERFDWADTNNPEVWSGNWANAQGETDLARGLFVANGEILIPGENTLEVWRDDGTAFIKEFQGHVPTGTLAPYTFTLLRGRPYFLDEARQLVTLEGRTPVVLSDPYAKHLQSLSNVNDGLGDVLTLGGAEWILLNFPTDGKSLCYDTILKRWSEWGNWNGTSYDRYDAKAFAHARKWGFAVCGGANGKLYKVSFDYTDDAGTAIRPLLRTATIDRGSPYTPKFCKRLTFRMKRTTPAATPSTMTVKYRDDGSTNWKATRTVTLEATGTDNLTGTLHQLGSYHQRQYELTFDAATKAALVSVEEEFDYGR